MSRSGLMVAASLAIAGCAAVTTDPHMGWKVAHQDWTPQQGTDWALAQCRAKSEQVSGYDWIDAGSNRVDAFDSCMEAFGYAR